MRGWDILKYSTTNNLGDVPLGGTFRYLTNIEFRNQLNQNLGMYRLIPKFFNPSNFSLRISSCSESFGININLV